MRLLDLLQEQLDIYRSGKVPDFLLMSDIMDYTLNFPDLCHHPLEERITARACLRNPALTTRLDELCTEHNKLAELCRKMAAAIRSVALDVELPRNWFDKLASSYIATYYEHMKMEETFHFPMADQALTADDWHSIDALADTDKDPLFGDDQQKHYQDLYARILRHLA